MHKSVLSILMSLSLAVPMAHAGSMDASDVNAIETGRGASQPSAPARQESRPAPAAPRVEAPRPAPAPRVEAPRPAPAPRVEAPRPAPAPRVEAPRPAPVQAPRVEQKTAPQQAPKIEAAQQRAQQDAQQRAQQPQQRAPEQRPAAQQQPARQPEQRGQEQRPAAQQPARQEQQKPTRQNEQTPAQESRQPERKVVAPANPLPRGIPQAAQNVHKQEIARPEVPKSAPLKVVPTKDGGQTQHFDGGKTVHLDKDGKVRSQYDPATHKTVYNNKDGSSTVSQGSRSIRTQPDGSRIIKDARSGQVTHYDATAQKTTIRSPGKTVEIDHKTNIVTVSHPGRPSANYIQRPTANGGYVRTTNITINNVRIERNYVNVDRYGRAGSYYSPNIYSHPYLSAFVAGVYGGLYLSGAYPVNYYGTPFGYGYAPFAYRASVCWFGCGIGYIGYAPYTTYSWSPWYGYYYTPSPYITYPYEYSLTYLIAEAIENRAQARRAREQQALQDAADLKAKEDAIALEQDAEKAEDLRQELETLKLQLKETQAEVAQAKADNASVIQQNADKSSAMSQEAIEAQKTTISHINADIAKGNKDQPALMNVVDFLNTKAVHGFEVHEELQLATTDKKTGESKSCNLDEGDTMKADPSSPFDKDNDTSVNMIVLSSVPGDCAPGQVVNISVSKLQEMLNASVEKVSDSMGMMADKKLGQSELKP